MKYKIKPTSRFKRDLKLAQKRKCDIEALIEVVNMLASGLTLPPKYNDHALTGDYSGCRECATSARTGC